MSLSTVIPITIAAFLGGAAAGMHLLTWMTSKGYTIYTRKDGK